MFYSSFQDTRIAPEAKKKIENMFMFMLSSLFIRDHEAKKLKKIKINVSSARFFKMYFFSPSIINLLLAAPKWRCIINLN